ncbi:hypothetical protein ACOME3_010429 [Neoechinorhynchus agilis]
MREQFYNRVGHLYSHQLPAAISKVIGIAIGTGVTTFHDVNNRISLGASHAKAYWLDNKELAIKFLYGNLAWCLLDGIDIAALRDNASPTQQHSFQTVKRYVSGGVSVLDVERNANAYINAKASPDRVPKESEDVSVHSMSELLEVQVMPGD